MTLSESLKKAEVAYSYKCDSCGRQEWHVKPLTKFHLTLGEKCVGIWVEVVWFNASFLETKRRKLGLFNAEVMLDVGYLIGFVEALRIGEPATEVKLVTAKKTLMKISEALKDNPDAVFGEEKQGRGMNRK